MVHRRGLYYAGQNDRSTMMPKKTPTTPPIFRMNEDVDSHASDGPLDSEETYQQFAGLLLRLVEGQDRQNELLEQISCDLILSKKPPAAGSNEWRDAHPATASKCRAAAQTLSRVQANLIDEMASDVIDAEEMLLESEFTVTEFIDRYASRLAHLNNVIQAMSQLGGN